MLKGILEGICFGVPWCLTQLSVRLLVLAQVTISWFMSSSPALGFTMTAWNLLEILCPPSLSAPPPLTLSLSLSK